MSAPTRPDPNKEDLERLYAGSCCPDGEHALRVKGYLGMTSPTLAPDCDRPLRVKCSKCDYWTVWRCSGHRESSCKPCAGRYRRRVRAVAESGMKRRRSSAGYLYLLTVTGPGRRSVHRLHKVDVKRSKTRACRCSIDAPPLAEWNASHSARWNRLRTALKRDNPALQYMRGVEVQDRGVLHDHALVWSPEPLDVLRVQQLALAAGFGCVLDLAKCDPMSKRAAYYVSKYVTKATDSRQDVPWLQDFVDTRTGEVTRGIGPGRYRTWSCSRDWGDTMSTVRAAKAAYARMIAARPAAELVEALAVLEAALGPVTTVHPKPPD